MHWIDWNAVGVLIIKQFESIFVVNLGITSNKLNQGNDVNSKKEEKTKKKEIK